MDQDELYGAALRLHQKLMKMQGGLLAAWYEKPLSPFVYGRQRRELEKLSDTLGEPMLLMMNGTERLYIPSINDDVVPGFVRGSSGQGQWGPTISKSLGRVVSDAELCHPQGEVEGSADVESYLFLMVTPGASPDLIMEHYARLRELGLNVILDLDLKQKLTGRGGDGANQTAEHDISLG